MDINAARNALMNDRAAQALMTGPARRRAAETPLMQLAGKYAGALAGPLRPFTAMMGTAMMDPHRFQTDPVRGLVDSTTFMDPRLAVGANVLLGRDDNTAAGTLDEARARGLY